MPLLAIRATPSGQRMCAGRWGGRFHEPNRCNRCCRFNKSRVAALPPHHRPPARCAERWNTVQTRTIFALQDDMAHMDGRAHRPLLRQRRWIYVAQFLGRRWRAVRQDTAPGTGRDGTAARRAMGCPHPTKKKRDRSVAAPTAGTRQIAI